MLVVGQTAHDGRRADIRQAEPVAEQRQQHLRIEEAAAVEQRKDEISIGRVEQCGIAVGDRHGDPQPLQYLPHLAVIESVIRLEERPVAKACDSTLSTGRWTYP